MIKKLLAKPLVKGVLKSLPIVGEVVSNVDAENERPKGELDITELVQALIRLVILIAILKGVMTTEEAESTLDVLK